MILRTFICIEIPDAQKKTLGAWLDARRKDIPEVRWVRPETLHVTLKFCGEIQQDMADGIQKNLMRMPQKGAFALAIKGIGAFPSLTAPRIVWSGLAGDLKRLHELHYDAETAALRVGLDREPRSFNAHITLGRNAPTPFPARYRTLLEREQPETTLWSVETVTLMQSELFPKGPKYTPLGVFKI